MLNTNNGDKMKNYSIWQDNIILNDYPELVDDKEVDVLIIGGGMTGISALYHLKNSKLKVMLVEQNKIGMSTTSRSTGKLSFLQNDLLDKISISSGDETTIEYINSQILAINLIKDVIEKEEIKCDLECVNSKLYTNKNEEVKYLEDLIKILEKNNIKVIKSKSSLVKSKYMIEVQGTFLFHPLKFIKTLSSKLSNIHENTSIKKIIKKDSYYICYSDKATIKAKYIIIASHYPYFNIPFIFPIKGTLEKSYLSASKYNGDKVSLISYSNPFISIRNYKNYLIYLSNSHSINKETCDKKNFNELLKKVNNLGLSPEYLWSNIDIITNDGLPYIGEIKENMFIGTGYNTWGLTNGFLAGKIISDIILQKPNSYIDLFDPKRINSEQIIGGINSAYKSFSGYITGFVKNKNNLKCTHMGCRLIYNEIEKTYDCPCHGSRFNSFGKVIMSPSNKDLVIKK